MNEYLIAVVIGIVEGITEYLPISSTGHMILVGNMLGFEGEKASVFEVFIQLGAILSVLFLYRQRFAKMLDFKWNPLCGGLTAYHVAAGIIPVLGIGYLLHKPIKALLFSPYTVIIGLIAGGLLMLAAERFAGRTHTHSVDDMTLGQAFWVGLFQILALWPGFSRSGSTISGGLFLGMSRKAAAEFSFIIAVPVMFVACLFDLLQEWANLNASDLMFFAIGFLVSFIVAYVSIVWFLKFLNRSTLTAFAVYRFIIAGLSYYYFFVH